jgi:hypothetical protein
MQKFLGALLILPTVAAFQADAAEDVGNKSAVPLVDQFQSDVHRMGKKPTSLQSYRSNMQNLIIGSTPFEEEKSENAIHETSRIEFTVDDLGHLSNWRVTEVSGSIARDFWTLYAVASCPPIKPSERIEAPFNMEVLNARLGAIVTSQEALDWRIEQGPRITRKSDARNIFFCLIPTSFIRTFPNTVSVADVVSRDNLVGIPLNRLCLDGGITWSNKSAANDFIGQKTEVFALLCEWSQFFSKNPNPSRDTILQFASSLKTKYKALLVTEGEPEAPLP